VRTNALEHEKSALAIAANIAALAQKEAVEQQRVVAAAAQTRALAEQKQTLEAAHEQAVDTLAANAALAAAQTHAESFAGMLEQANADWAAHPNGEQQRGAVIALREQKAYADAHHQIAGNLSRMLLSGTRVETPGNPHDPHNPGDVPVAVRGDRAAIPAGGLEDGRGGDAAAEGWRADGGIRGPAGHAV
jgi:hypothetical protein